MSLFPKLVHMSSQMACVHWCVPVESADNQDIVCVARTAPVYWDATIPELRDSVEALNVIIQAEYELMQRVCPSPQRRLRGDDTIFVSGYPRGAHCRSNALLHSSQDAPVPDGSRQVRLQLILRTGNLTYGLRPDVGGTDPVGGFSVRWDLDSVIYSDDDCPF